MGQVPISNIVNVQITLQASGITQAGFGVPCIVTDESPTTSWGSERIREYASTDEVLDDWSSSDDAYKAAAAIFSQTPKVPKVKIALEDSRVAQVQTIVFSGNLVSGNTINGKVNGVAITAVPFNTSNAQTLTDLATTLQATAAIGTASSNGTNTITCTSAKAGVTFTLSDFVVSGGASQATAAITTTVDSHGIVEDLEEISEQDDAWYGLIWNERDEDQVQMAAGAIETKRKIFITCSSDADILDDTDTDDIAYLLKAANYGRTAVIYNADPSDFADAAWMGRLFPYDPGSETWALKQLSSITADDLTSSERNAVLGKNANIYAPTPDGDRTFNGTMASGLFIDLRRGADWLQARMEERIFNKLANAIKIPFTNGGIAIIEAEVRAVLENGIRVGFLSPDPFDPVNGLNDPYTVSFPRASEVSDADKANRFLPDGKFAAHFAGAIHKVTIQGTISV